MPSGKGLFLCEICDIHKKQNKSAIINYFKTKKISFFDVYKTLNMKVISIILFAVLVGNFAFSQTDTSSTKELYIITKSNGQEIVGELLSDDGREILLLTESVGKIYINKSDIISMKKVSESEVGEDITEDFRNIGPFTTRYIFTTNALPIKKGEDYAMIQLYGPEVHFALSDNFNIGIMTTWIASPMVLAAKYSIKTKNENLNFSIGTLFGTSGYLNQFRGYGGLHFANVTLGNRERNFTFGAGYGYIDPGFNNIGQIPNEGTYVSSYSYFDQYSIPSTQRKRLKSAPMVSLSVMSMAGKKATFIFDAMIAFTTSRSYNVTTTTLSEPDYSVFPSVEGSYRHVVTHSSDFGVAALIMPGMRFQGSPNRAFQIAMAGVVGQTGGNYFSFPIPMVSWLFNF